MKLTFTPLSRKSVAEQVATRLRAEILSGRLAAGEKLPGERELSAGMGTNRNTLREATRTLEAQGLVHARQGDGVTVLDYRRDGDLQILPLFLTEARIEERAALLVDVLRLRRVLLVDMAGTAAERADADGLAALRQRLDEARAAVGDPARAVQADLDFYRTLARASGSLIAVWSFNTFARAYLDVVKAMPALWITPAGYLETLGALIDAIAARDPRETRRVLDRHLAGIDAVLVPWLTSGKVPLAETAPRGEAPRARQR
ncbi:MAG TPA: GntR family transcriptional regulator [Polyangia bacterium]|jgi:GntR family transcriptional repressor for pyruvate dehydrogenase complex